MNHGYSEVARAAISAYGTGLDYGSWSSSRGEMCLWAGWPFVMVVGGAVRGSFW